MIAVNKIDFVALPYSFSLFTALLQPQVHDTMDRQTDTYIVNMCMSIHHDSITQLRLYSSYSESIVTPPRTTMTKKQAVSLMYPG